MSSTNQEITVEYIYLDIDERKRFDYLNKILIIKNIIINEREIMYKILCIFCDNFNPYIPPEIRYIIRKYLFNITSQDITTHDIKNNLFHKI